MSHKLFNLILSLTLLTSLIGLIPTTVVQAAKPEPETTTYPYATDHLTVKLRAEAHVEKGTTSTHIASLDRALAEMNATALEAVPGLPTTYLVKLDSKNADIPAAVKALNNDPAVEYAEPDYLAKFSAAPDDPRYSEQWGLTKLQAEGAWDETLGSPNVVIAIIDSGIDLAHEDLAPNLWLNPGEIPANSLDDDNNGFVDDVQGWNFVNATNDVQDFIGHGSLVAGVAAAKTNNTLGIAGMCGNCRIMPVKITQVSGFANYSDIAAGVNYAVEKGAKVINLSVGGYADSITVKNAINNALSKNIVVVGGVGNDNKSDKFYPAAYEGVIAVAGTDASDVRVASSNYGAWVDISAPGQNILSTTLGDYSSDTGTSYATPFVSGAAGLLLSLHPEWTPAMVRSQFLHTTDSIDSANPGFVGMLGSGRLNAALATQPSHPILTYKTYAGNGTPELRPDFGSTVSLNVTLYNDWADAAGVTGTLSSTDPLVTITTDVADFGTILAGASQANSIPFSFDIAASAGYNHDMPFTLALSANDGSYTTTVNFTITTRSSEELVSGTIDADATWTNDKTYKVTGDVSLASGFTLTIEPGTVVQFTGNYSLNLGGTLIAQGTAVQPIRFEPYEAGGTWNRIFFGDTSLDAVTTTEGVYQSGNILQYVNISGAASGIACTTATPFLDRVVADQGGVTCSLGGTDLWMQDSTLTGTISITGGGSTPEHLARMNVNGNTTLPASQVSDSTFNGSLTIQGSGQVNNITTSGLTISGVGDVQQVKSDGNIYISSGQVTGSEANGGNISTGTGGTISGCSTFGGSLTAGTGSTITHNNIEDAPGNGITTSGNSTVTFNRIVGAGQGIVAGAGTLENNLIVDIAGNGLRPGTASVRNNTFIEIAGNGVYLQNVPLAFEYNNFEFNTGPYDVYVTVPKTTTINLVAQYNWWGTTDYNLIKLRTWDYNDDATLAKLITIPVLTAPSPTAPAYVRSVTLDPASPVGIQTVDFTVGFSRPMNMDAAPWVFFHLSMLTPWPVYHKGNSGLPGDYVSAIAIDPDGSKWFGTEGGGANFDGTNWTVYNTGNSGLPHNSVSSISVNADGSKWFGTWGGGVAHFEGTNWTVYDTGNSGLPNDEVYTIAVDPDGSKWIGTSSGGVAHFDDTTWTVYNTGNSGLPSNSVDAIAFDVNGSKWFGTDGGGVARFDGTTWVVYDADNSGLPNNTVFATTVDPDGSIWFGTDGGVARFDGTTWKVYHTGNSGLPNNSVRAIAIEVDGTIWFGTDGGVTQFDSKTWTVYDPDNSGLPNSSVRAISFDADGSKWFGTAGGGVGVWIYPNHPIQDNPTWLDDTHFQASYDFTTLIKRGDYVLTVADALDGSGMSIVPVSGTTFTVDYAGEISDTTPPAAPLVSAWGNGSLSQLSAQAAASDPDSEIVGYRYAIGSTPGGSDVVNWTNTPYTEITRSGLTLQADQAYYVSFQARNLGGLWSVPGVSNAVINGIVPNDPPVAVNDSYSINEDTTLTIAAPGVLVNDTDPESNPLTAIKVTDPAHGTLTLNASGSFTYTPNANWNGSDSFTYKTNDGIADSNVATVNITVTAVNDPPVADNQDVRTLQDAPEAITLTATDVEGSAITWAIVTGPTHGTLSGTAPNITYSPTSGWTGSDSFTFKANDGTDDSNIATVSITVAPGNIPPVAADDSFSMDEDTVLSIAAPGVLDNDTDADSDPLTSILVTGTVHGTLTLNANGSFTYTPDANWYGTDTFTYKTNDGIADSNVATVSITVADVPETRSIYLPLIYR